jgi:hypothetical protein
MLMGAGKTTVVGPLLALMLADGRSLVLQVVPAALLPMSRGVLRFCFSQGIFPKRIRTFCFDRNSATDPGAARAMLARLRQVRNQRGVVVCTAASLKCLMLKFLEELHDLDRTTREPHDLGGSPAGPTSSPESSLESRALERSESSSSPSSAPTV